MPSEMNTEVDELQLEVIDNGESQAGSQDTEGEGETEKVQVNLEKDDTQSNKLTPAQENAKRQEETYLNRISGEEINPKTEKPYEIEDAPKWLQPKLKEQLFAKNEVPETEAVVKKVLEQEREDVQFKEIQSQIPKLTPTQAQELQDKYKDLKVLGKVKALQLALDLMGLSREVKEAEMRGVAKGKMSLPKSGNSATRGSGEAEHVIAAQSDKSWKDYLAKRVERES